MSVFNRSLDLIIIYKIIKYLNMDWKKWEIYKLGIIDDKGNKIKKIETKEEKKAFSYFIRFVWRLKKMLQKITFGSKIGGLFVTYLMLKENKNSDLINIIELLEKNKIDSDLFFKEYFKNEKKR